MIRPHPHFGEYLRATRQRFFWVQALENFVRLSGEGPFMVELAAPGYLPGGSRGRRKERPLYRIGWDKEPEIVGPLAKLPRTTSRVTYFVDDNCERVAASGGAD